MIAELGITVFIMVVTSGICCSFDEIVCMLGVLMVSTVLIINRKVVFFIGLLRIVVKLLRFGHHRLAQVFLFTD